MIDPDKLFVSFAHCEHGAVNPQLITIKYLVINKPNQQILEQGLTDSIDKYNGLIGFTKCDMRFGGFDLTNPNKWGVELILSPKREGTVKSPGFSQKDAFALTKVLQDTRAIDTHIVAQLNTKAATSFPRIR